MSSQGSSKRERANSFDLIASKADPSMPNLTQTLQKALWKSLIEKDLELQRKDEVLKTLEGNLTGIKGKIMGQLENIEA